MWRSNIFSSILIFLILFQTLEKTRKSIDLFTVLLHAKVSLANRSLELALKLSGIVINTLIIVLSILSSKPLLIRWYGVILDVDMPYTAKHLNCRHPLVLRYLSIIKRCPLVGGSLTKVVSVETKHFVLYSRYVHYLRYPQLESFTVVCTDN